jgi:hypothetical protein
MADEFRDRAELMSQLGALVEDHIRGRPSWVVLLGTRKIGKTSVLRELQRRVRTQGNVVVWLDLFEIDTRVQEVFTAFLWRMLVGASEAAGHLDLAARLRTRPPPFGGGLAHEVSTSLPFPCVGRALGLIDIMRSTRVGNAEVTEALGLTELFGQELGPVWVVLDEVQELAALDRQRPFSGTHTVFKLMRSVWQGHEKVSYWATGSQVSMLSRVFGDRRSPFHGHFKVVHVGPFGPREAADLLLEQVDPTLRGDDARDAADLAARAVGGHPFYLQVLGEELELRRVGLSTRSVKSLLQEILLTPTGRLALHLTGVLRADAGSGKQLAVLRALARGEASLAELVAANPSMSREETHPLLRRLEAADLVFRDHETHRFQVADAALAAYLRAGGLSAEPSPAVLGDEGERAVARHLLSQGLRPVFQSYRSLGPADLVVLEPGRRLAIQVKRTTAPVHLSEVEYQRLRKWASTQDMTAAICQVEPEPPGRVRYWSLESARRTRGGRRFEEDASLATALELLDTR